MPATSNITPDLIRTALSYIPAHLPRDEWAKLGMAIKSEFADATGFELFDAWSATAKDGYDQKATRSTWKSIKASGGVSVATLLHMAQERGFTLPTATETAPKPTPAQLAERERQAHQKREAEQARIAAGHEAAATQALARWQAASDCTAQAASPYLLRKGVQAYGVRSEANGTLLVPLCDASGKLWNVQAIAPQKPTEGSDKLFMKGGKKSGLWHAIGFALPQSQATLATAAKPPPVVLIAEGYATAASLHEATAYPVAVAFDAGNLVHVAKALRAALPGTLLVLCADDDHDTQAKSGNNPGQEKAHAAAKAVRGIVATPEGLQAGETDFNDLHARLGLEAVRECVATAIAAHAKPEQKKGDKLTPFAPDSDAREEDQFSVTAQGVYFLGRDQQGKPKPPLKLCSRLEVTAGVRSFEGDGFGYLLAFPDPLGIPKVWAMPARMLAGDGNEYRSTLLSKGLRIEPGNTVKALLTTYIQSRKPSAWARSTERTGWHSTDGPSGKERVYVQPHRTLYANEACEAVHFQTDAPMENTLSEAGTLAQWREHVAALCVGNSRLVLCVSTAFAGLAMSWVGAENGGFHLRGDSSSGKTTALRVAASVFGAERYMQGWRATDNAIEAIAARHCDALLVLDELAQVDHNKAGEVAYLLGNGQGKGRGSRSATAKPLARWKSLFLSAGEVSLAQHIAEGGKKERAGQQVRMLDIPADAGCGLGVFECLHGLESGQALSERLTKAARRYHGAASTAFIQHLLDTQGSVAESLRSLIEAFKHQAVPAAAHGQVQRAANRFALLAAAGELATQAGITGWPQGEAMRAARRCFEDWIAARGGLAGHEEYAMVSQLRQFIDAHGDARFHWWHRAADDRAGKTMNRAGFKRLVGPSGKPVKTNSEHQREFGGDVQPDDAKDTRTEYFVQLSTFDDEVCKGFDSKAFKRVLAARGILVSTPSGRTDRRERVPGVGYGSYIKINPEKLSEASE